MNKKLEKSIGVEFKNKKLLQQAMIHRSYLNETDQELKSNERLEFLGDAVLELWTTKQLFKLFPKLPEGVLTNMRAAIVCTTSLAETAQTVDLGSYLYLSKGEDQGKGRQNPSLLADTFEALIGAIYLDQGGKITDSFLEKFLLEKIKKIGKNGDVKDEKTKLQELVQAKLGITPRYEVLKEEGPDHAKIFTTAVFFDKKKITSGKGESKRKAEINTAKKALTLVAKQDIIG